MGAEANQMQVHEQTSNAMDFERSREPVSQRLLLYGSRMCLESELEGLCDFVANLAEDVRKEVVELYVVPSTDENLAKYESQKAAAIVERLEKTDKSKPQETKPDQPKIVQKQTLVNEQVFEIPDKTTEAPAVVTEILKEEVSPQIIIEVQGGGPSPEDELLLLKALEQTEVEVVPVDAEIYEAPTLPISSTRARKELVIAKSSAEAPALLIEDGMADVAILQPEVAEVVFDETAPESPELTLLTDTEEMFIEIPVADEIENMELSVEVDEVLFMPVSFQVEVEQSKHEIVVRDMESLIEHVGEERIAEGFPAVLPEEVEVVLVEYAQTASIEEVEHISNLKILIEAASERLESLASLDQLEGMEAEQIVIMVQKWYEEILDTLEIEHSESTARLFVEELIKSAKEADLLKRIISEEEATHEHKRLFRSTQSITQDMIEKLQAQIGRRVLILTGFTSAA